MSESGKASTKIQLQSKARHQEVVVVPQLRRIGNVQGDDYEKDEVISDCQGEFDKI
jgi:hypothetical protein